MKREPDRLERVARGSPTDRLGGLGPREPELARRGSGRQILVAAAGDVGIQPGGDGRRAAERTGRLLELVELVQRLDVDGADPGLDGPAELVSLLADPREDDPLGCDPGLECLRELAA